MAVKKINSHQLCIICHSCKTWSLFKKNIYLFIIFGCGGLCCCTGFSLVQRAGISCSVRASQFHGFCCGAQALECVAFRNWWLVGSAVAATGLLERKLNSSGPQA